MSLPFGDGGTQQVTPMMPAFSPDGTKLALVISPTANDSFQDNVLPQVPSPNPLGLTESIAYLSFDESTPAFNPTLNTLFDSNNAAFKTLGPGGTPWNGIAYPSFTPDSSAIAFHVGLYATGCNSFDVSSPNPDVSCGDLGSDNGALFIATLAAKQPIRMANADTPPVAADAYSAVEPTFNPVVRGGYSWVVFTSLRQFGNQPWPGEVAEAGATSQLINAKRRLWVAAVDTTIGTTDPSHPAIYLEGQTDTPNMRGFWTLSSCIATWRHGWQPRRRGADRRGQGRCGRRQPRLHGRLPVLLGLLRERHVRRRQRRRLRRARRYVHRDEQLLQRERRRVHGREVHRPPASVRGHVRDQASGRAEGLTSGEGRLCEEPRRRGRAGRSR
jgi:hypothetical protein